MLLAWNSTESADSKKQGLCRLQPLTREQWLAMQHSTHRLSRSLPVLLDQVRKGVSWPQAHIKVYFLILNRSCRVCVQHAKWHQCL